MKISVEYIDQSAITMIREENISKLGLIKHMAIAGQGYAPRPRKLLRTLGMLLHYSEYLKSEMLSVNKFSLPPKYLSDPTEKSQFSNIIGKAIADLLSRRIDKSRYTVNYEAAMRVKGLPISGTRPDLIAFAPPLTMFSIEAKGYSGGPGDMAGHKLQSKSPHQDLAVNFSVACISYDLYETVRTKYHDPYVESVPFDNMLFARLTANYYRGLSEFLNPAFFEIEETVIRKEHFFEIRLLTKRSLDIIGTGNPLSLCLLKTMSRYEPKLLLPKEIHRYVKLGAGTEDEFFTPIDEDGIYIDTDRVGLRVSLSANRNKALLASRLASVH